MIKINKRNRTELKSFFVENAIPTEVQFADLIDGMVNQKEDGFAKLPGNPLSIEASGDAASQKKAINFYKDFSDEKPDWVLSLNPRSDPADAATAHAGLSISDATGNSRLFIDKSIGNVGIGTVTPMQTLDINGGIHVKNGVIQKGGATITSTSDLGLYSQEPGEGIRIVSNAAPIQFFTDSGKGTTSGLSIESSGQVYIPGRLTVGALTAAALTVGGVVVDGQVKGHITQEDWRNVSFKDGWKNFGGNTPESPVSYFKDSFGMVHLKGTANASVDANDWMFVLPSGYRPSHVAHLSCSTNDNNVNGLILIKPDGYTQLHWGGKEWISLAGITFRTA